MLPLSMFRSSQFTGANLTTLAVYTGLGGTTFALVLQLQKSLGYSALEAGLALVPAHGDDAAVLVAVGRARAAHRSARSR